MTANKSDSTKSRLDLLPPQAMMEVGQVLRYGAENPAYGEHNWAKGMDWGRFLGAIFRHALQWANCEGPDPDTGCSHLAHIVCSALFLLEYEKTGIGRDNRVGHAVARDEGPRSSPCIGCGSLTSDFAQIGNNRGPICRACFDMISHAWGAELASPPPSSGPGECALCKQEGPRDRCTVANGETLLLCSGCRSHELGL